MHQRFAKNEQGRDWIVGDIHGQFSRLQGVLDSLGFDPENGDRLFPVGDLVDRGPESAQALEWIGKPWFHAVQGNHEQLLHDYHRGLIPAGYYAANGGGWAIGLTPEERQPMVDALCALPLAITLETEGGAVGIVHANCQGGSWAYFCRALETQGQLPQERAGQHYMNRAANMCVWDRSRIQGLDESTVHDVRAVVVGHTPLLEMVLLGNVFHIDTRGWLDGKFTILDAATLTPALATESA
jgi:serine/threonine protein phosphatase 1